MPVVVLARAMATVAMVAARMVVAAAEAMAVAAQAVAMVAVAMEEVRVEGARAAAKSGDPGTPPCLEESSRTKKKPVCGFSNWKNS